MNDVACLYSHKDLNLGRGPLTANKTTQQCTIVKLLILSLTLRCPRRKSIIETPNGIVMCIIISQIIQTSTSNHIYICPFSLILISLLGTGYYYREEGIQNSSGGVKFNPY